MLACSHHAPRPIVNNRYYNPADGFLYGVGTSALSDDTPLWNRTVDRLDPTTLEAAEVGVVPGGWGTEVGAAGAVANDVPGGSIFWLGCEGSTINSTVSTTGFYLIQNSLVNASVLSVSAQPLWIARGFPPACPSSFQWVRS